jgi:hypothetical protein
VVRLPRQAFPDDIHSLSTGVQCFPQGRLQDHDRILTLNLGLRSDYTVFPSLHRA